MDTAIIAIILVLISAFLGIFISYPMIKAMTKIQNARQGERTKFEIDITDKGYDYYKDKIDKWLNDVGFSKYKQKKDGRYLTYHKKSCIFKFGFNYYHRENKIIIEAWLNILGKESPLTSILYQNENGNIPIMLDQQAKDEYINFLNSLINMPEEIHERNEVTLLNNINVLDFKTNNKKEKYATIKLILGIILFSIIIALIIQLPR